MKILYFILFIFLSCDTNQDRVKIIALNAYNYIEGKLGIKKSLSERDSLARFLAEEKADIVFLSEMGGERAISDLKTRLKYYGLDYPFSSLVDAGDKRKLLIFSFFKPLIKHKLNLNYFLKEYKRKVLRGLAHCVFKINNDYSLHVLGVHLKSRLFHELNSNKIRFEEAKLVRKQIDEILKNESKANILLLGDFNDDKKSNTLMAIRQSNDISKNLFPLNLADNSGDYWTYHYRYRDIYSRIDYALASYFLLPEIIKERSFIFALKGKSFSDHRPLIIEISPFNREEKSFYIPKEF